MVVNSTFPFVFYRLPGDTHIHIMSQKNDTLVQLAPGELPLNKTGFAYVPWCPDDSHRGVFIKADNETILAPNDLDQVQVSPIIEFPRTKADVFVSDQNLYRDQIKAIHEAIEAGTIRKAILSRIQTEALSTEAPLQWFAKLCTSYPNVLCYWVHLPDECDWMGATPEVLTDVTDGVLSTVSLAGSQANTGQYPNNVVWGAKEQDEQQIVTDSIRDTIETQLGRQPQMKGPYTFSTGPVLHLKTDFSIELTDTDKPKIAQLVNALQPTPAISGLPKQAAINLINSIEIHDRSFYTGYLGPIHDDGSLKLFVNLRCMELLKDHVALYLGGGITAGSTAEAEWDETVFKTRTLLNVIQE